LAAAAKSGIGGRSGGNSLDVGWSGWWWKRITTCQSNDGCPNLPILHFFFTFVQKAFEVTFTFHRLFELKKKPCRIGKFGHPIMIGFKQKWKINCTN